MRIDRFAAVVLVALPLVLAGSARAEDGKAVFESTCAGCHGADGKSDTPKGKALKAPNLLEVAGLKGAPADVVALVEKSVRSMPKHAQVSPKVSDAQLAAVAEYVRILAGGAAQ